MRLDARVGHPVRNVRTMKRSERRGAWRRASMWLMGLAAGTAAGLLLRLTLFVAAAWLVRLVGEIASATGLTPPWLDPVYSHAAQQSLAALHLRGLAVGGPPGAWLHSALPQWFVDPAQAHAGLMRVVVQSGSPVLGRLLAAGVAHAGVLAVGLLLVHRGWRSREPLLGAAGIAVQAQVALGILGSQPSLRELEATGVSFAANALAPWLSMRDVALTDSASRVWPPLVAATLVGLALLVAYAPGGLVLLSRHRARRITLASATLVVLSSAACAGIVREEEAVAAPLAAPVAPAAAIAP